MKAFYLFEIFFFFLDFRKENEKAFFLTFFFWLKDIIIRFLRKKEENTFLKKPNVVKILFLKKTFFLYTIFQILGKKGKHFVLKVFFFKKGHLCLENTFFGENIFWRIQEKSFLKTFLEKEKTFWKQIFYYYFFFKFRVSQFF